jgi:transcription antitermination factor NusG
MYPADECGVSTGCGPQSAWHALYTCFQHEKVVARILSNKRFEVFLPLYSAAHQWKDRVKRLTLPLFPCYVFVRGGLARHLDIVSTPGVCDFVGISGKPSDIPESEIETVRRVIDKSLRVEPHPFLNRGDRVRVKSGPLEGIEGTLVRKKNSFRLVLSVELLQKSVAVELDVAVVERAPARNPSVALRGMPALFPAGA